VIFFRGFVALSFNEEKAELLGLRPALTHGLLLLLVTLAIVGSFRTVGALLVFGLMVGPPATAALLVRRVPAMMAVAAVIGVVSVTLGLVISYHANISGSATMAVLPIAGFFLTLAIRNLRTQRNPR
jgi:ABC-type Mn2+/Zn2+ transport system permease subunit